MCKAQLVFPHPSKPTPDERYFISPVITLESKKCWLNHLTRDQIAETPVTERFIIFFVSWLSRDFASMCSSNFQTACLDGFFLLCLVWLLDARKRAIIVQRGEACIRSLARKKKKKKKSSKRNGCTAGLHSDSGLLPWLIPLTWGIRPHPPHGMPWDPKSQSDF